MKIVSLFFLLVLAIQLDAQDLSNLEKKAIIDSINFQLIDKYVFPEVADLMAKDLQTRYNAGEYDQLNSREEFAAALKSHLFAISKDKHIGVSFNGKMAANLRKPKEEEDPVEKFNRIRERFRKINFGFEELKIMNGNVGYIKLTGFTPTKYAGETAVSAMNFVSNCDALIFDLRVNYGGDDSMIQLLISYLYPAQPIHLNNFFHRKEDKTTQTWTLPIVQGVRMPKVPVYVLTSSSTISAGEEFAYDLKHLKRGTIVGEITAGAANFGEEFIAKGDFIVWVPTGRAINPITKTNWEGIGVTPHIKAKAADALEVAHQMALEKLKE